VAVGLRRDDTGTPSSAASRATRLAITSGPPVGPEAGSTVNSTVVSPSGVVTVIVVGPSGQPGGTTTVMMLPSLLTMATVSPHMVTVAPVRLVPTIWMVAPGSAAPGNTATTVGSGGQPSQSRYSIGYGSDDPALFVRIRS
jgi:hypothetical protein